MKYVTRDAFDVVGIEIRTTNADEATANGKIPQLWGRFHSEAILERIPHRKPGAPTLAVYSDYENGTEGTYSLLLGTEVTQVGDVSDLPEGLVVRSIAGAKYAVFESSQGPFPQIVHDVWKRIWAWDENTPGEARAFRADFEVYDARASDPAKARIEIFISVRS